MEFIWGGNMLFKNFLINPMERESDFEGREHHFSGKQRKSQCRQLFNLKYLLCTAQLNREHCNALSFEQEASEALFGSRCISLRPLRDTLVDYWWLGCAWL